MKIGLIAGGGQFPLLFTEKAVSKGYEVYTVGFTGETDEHLANQVTDFKWLYLGQVTKLIRFFKQHEVKEAVMLGSIGKNNIFKNIRPDLKALSFIAQNVKTHDDAVLTAFADLLAKEGIQVKPSTFLLPDLISPQGCWTKRKPDRAETKDIEFGWKMAEKIGQLDIGQCVVVGNGTVLAVEAIDGTDATIQRGGSLAGKNTAVVIKRSKPNQDLRFDLPSTGLKTIETMAAAGVDVLALEAGKSISFDREEMIAFANQHNICIIALTGQEIK